jgi:uncharacterized Rmd1/YagE family protein
MEPNEMSGANEWNRSEAEPNEMSGANEWNRSEAEPKRSEAEPKRSGTEAKRIMSAIIYNVASNFQIHELRRPHQ